MKKILLFTLLSFLTLISHPIYADSWGGTPEGQAKDSMNLNSQNFKVYLNDMDPLYGTHNSYNPSGPEAFFSFIGKVTDILLVLVPILAGVSLLIAGYIYIFSAGDSEKALRAKTIIKWNIIAIFVSLLSYAIIKTVASFFS